MQIIFKLDWRHLQGVNHGHFGLLCPWGWSEMMKMTIRLNFETEYWISEIEQFWEWKWWQVNRRKSPEENWISEILSRMIATSKWLWKLPEEKHQNGADPRHGGEDDCQNILRALCYHVLVLWEWEYSLCLLISHPRPFVRVIAKEWCVRMNFRTSRPHRPRENDWSKMFFENNF